jgi:hypothetical protein
VYYWILSRLNAPASPRTALLLALAVVLGLVGAFASTAQQTPPVPVHDHADLASVNWVLGGIITGLLGMIGTALSMMRFVYKATAKLEEVSIRCDARRDASEQRAHGIRDDQRRHSETIEDLQKELAGQLNADKEAAAASAARDVAVGRLETDLGHVKGMVDKIDRRLEAVIQKQLDSTST